MLPIVLGAALALQLSSPTSQVAAACSQPDRDVKVVDAKTPDLSEAYLKAHKPTGKVLLTVSVGPKGEVNSVTIRSATTKDENVVKAAIEAARTSTYAPALHDCKPVSGTYLFKVEVAP